MRLLAACLAAPLALVAADGDVQITAYHNSVIVTAPAEQAGPTGAILSQRMTVNFQDTPIADVADFLRHTTGLNVVVSPDLLARNAIVSLTVKDMELGNMLKWISTVGGVHYGWLHKALYFSDKPLDGPPRTKIYDVSDLVMPIRNFPGPELQIPSAGGAGAMICFPQTDDTQPTTSTEELVELMKKHIPNAK